MKDFLKDLGANWFPIEVDPKEVSGREINGLNRADSFASKKFVSDFTQDRFLKQPQGEVMLSERFFDLSWVMGWLSIAQAIHGFGTVRKCELLHSLKHCSTPSRESVFLTLSVGRLAHQSHR